MMVSLKLILHLWLLAVFPSSVIKKKKKDVCFAAIVSHEKLMTSQCFMLSTAPHVWTAFGLVSSSLPLLSQRVLGLNNLTHISAWHTSALGVPWVPSSWAHTCCIIKKSALVCRAWMDVCAIFCLCKEGYLIELLGLILWPCRCGRTSYTVPDGAWGLTAVFCPFFLVSTEKSCFRSTNSLLNHRKL